VRRIPIAFQNTYSDLLARLQDASLAAHAREPGGFVAKTVKGRRYWYRQAPRDPETGRQRQTYVGPETPDLLAGIAEHVRWVDDARERRDLVRSLVAGGGVPAPPAAFGRVIEALAEAGVFRLRGVLVGTAAFQTYAPMLGIRLGSAVLATADIDVAQFRSISVAVEDRVPPMLATLRAIDPAFRPISKPLHGEAPIAFTGAGLRVEFLTPMRGPDEDAPAPLPALGTASQPLRFLDYLIYRELPAVILHGAGVLVRVPDPARYAWHKCLVSQRRVVDREKARKDLLQAEALFEVLAVDRPGDVKDYWEELAMPGRVRWQEIARAGLEGVSAPVRELVLRLIA
jgi:hypothetical protein